jgi:hypothetical protein
MNAVAKSAGRGCTRSLLVYGLSAVVGLLLICCFVFVPLWYVNANNLDPLYLFIPFGLLIIILLGAAVGFPLLVILLRKRSLDATFSPLGLQGSSYNLYFRQYHGTYRGREVAVYIARGPIVDLEVKTPLRTRLGVSSSQSETAFAADLLGKQRLSLPDLDLTGLNIFAPEPAWTGDLLRRPGLLTLLRRMVTPLPGFVRQNVILRPGWLRLQTSGGTAALQFNITIPPAAARQALEDLINLAEQMEDQPAPQQVQETTALEESAQRMRKFPTALVTALVIGSTIVCIFGGGILITLLLLNFAP